MQKDLVDYSIAYYKYGGLSEALFNVNPLGALKGALFVLNASNKILHIGNSLSIGSSVSQTEVLSKHQSQIISYPKKPTYRQIEIKTFFIFIYRLITTIYDTLCCNLYRDKLTFTARFALFLQINVGLHIAKRLRYSGMIKILYIATDHCPIVLSCIYTLKESFPSLFITYEPHGGNVGWENAYRSLSWGLFDEIIVESLLQKQVLEYWATMNNINVAFVVRSPSSPIKVNNFSDDGEKSDTKVVIWLNQADLWPENIDKFRAVIYRLEKQRIINFETASVVVKETTNDNEVKRIFTDQPAELYTSFSDYLDNRKQGDKQNVMHVVLSSTVVLKVLTLGEIIFFTESSPLHHDEGLQFALSQRGFAIQQVYPELWTVLTSIETQK